MQQKVIHVTSLQLKSHGLTEEQGELMLQYAQKEGKSYALRSAYDGDSLRLPGHPTNDRSIAFRLMPDASASTLSTSSPVTFVVLREGQMKAMGLTYEGLCEKIRKGESVSLNVNPTTSKAHKDKTQSIVDEPSGRKSPSR